MNPFLRSASSLYGLAAAWRRRWYVQRPHRQRHLSQPVISVGNLRTGGSGKTPVVEAVARILLAEGERPAILTRGYGRRTRESNQPVVVSDGSKVLADVDRSGDEPTVLARHLPGVPVVVSANRHAGGLVAEQRFGVTVHLLDDGFQHLALARNVDLVLVDPDDLAEPLLPAGHLREPLAAAACADALLVHGDEAVAADIARRLNAGTVFTVVRRIGAPRAIGAAAVAQPLPGGAVLAVAAIARPERFLSDLAASSWQVAGAMTFRDHHWFTPSDVDAIRLRVRSDRAGAIVTTEKDAVRLERCDLTVLDVPLLVVPLTATIEPPDAFRTWLLGRLSAVRAGAPHPASGSSHPQPAAATRTQ